MNALPTYRWMYRLVDGWVMSCQIIKNGINIDVIKIIQVCSKIYDLWRLLYLWVDVWVVGWMGGVMSLTKSRINFLTN